MGIASCLPACTALHRERQNSSLQCCSPKVPLLKTCSTVQYISTAPTSSSTFNSAYTFGSSNTSLKLPSVHEAGVALFDVSVAIRRSDDLSGIPGCQSHSKSNFHTPKQCFLTNQIAWLQTLQTNPRQRVLNALQQRLL